MKKSRRKIDRSHLQLRLTPKMRAEIGDMAEKLGESSADIIRGALLFGLPVFEAMLVAQNEIITRLVASLKRDSRKKKRR
jgi:hypothetical protein